MMSLMHSEDVVAVGNNDSALLTIENLFQATSKVSIGYPHTEKKSLIRAHSD